jgi:hypothetical protein
MSETKFPCFVYHPTKPAFICPSQDFLDTLVDGNEYEFEPFTGPRKPVKEAKKCATCLDLKLKVNEYELQNEELKLEVDRLRAALKITEGKVAAQGIKPASLKANKDK